MFYKDELDNNGKNVRNYTIIDGDSFPASITIKKNGQPVDSTLIKQVVFKLGKKDFENNTINQVLNKQFNYNEDKQNFYLVVSSEEIKSIGVGDYIYEYELTMLDGFITTIMQAKFKIKPDITQKEI